MQYHDKVTKVWILNLTNFASVKLPAPAPSSQQQSAVTYWLISYVELQSSSWPATDLQYIEISLNSWMLKEWAKIKFNIQSCWKILHQQCLIVDILYQINVLIKTSWTNFQTTLNIKTLNRIKIKIHYDTSLVRKQQYFLLLWINWVFLINSICFAKYLFRKKL